MPHFVLDCSGNILEKKNAMEIMLKVHDTANATGLFDPGDIKVRINPFDHYINGNDQADFIHIFANIMEGRTTKQKHDLSKRIMATLKEMFPKVPILSINIRDFERATYSNRSMV
jgi:5-carboxymethyl-2-hydroxymuconate isomerase